MSATNEVERTDAKRAATGADQVERVHEGRVFLPAVDIYEDDEALYLIAEMPGVDEQHLDITLEKNVLTLHGKVPPETRENLRLAYAEYETGDYERSFTVSEAIDREAISATMKNGVLRLTLPKAAPAKTKRIEVRGG